MANITKRTVDAASKGARDQFVWDDELAGFGLKITPAGSKVYIFQYRQPRPGAARTAPTRRYTIGRHDPLTPDQARKRAREMAALVAQGIDPRASAIEAVAAKDEAKRIEADRKRLESELAFSKIAAVWLDHYEHEKARRPSSLAMARLVVNRYLAPKLASKPLPHITRTDLQPIFDAIPSAKRGTRRAVFAYASILFGWAHKRGD
ncbi:Arm DNA-binding domain-containing protein, partial [Novosphingobium sp.]|uniref:Arm DNA-binding domain-containing protein n=1 Tax=Novosphingobium sp. TaxID=1874826 RepID=UPI0025D3ABDB